MNHIQVTQARREAQCLVYNLAALADKTGDFVGYARTGQSLARVVCLVNAPFAAGESCKVTIKGDNGDTLMAQFTLDSTTCPPNVETDASANIDYSKEFDPGRGIEIDVDYTAGGGPTPAANLQVRVYTA